MTLTEWREIPAIQRRRTIRYNRIRLGVSIRLMLARMRKEQA